MDPDTVGIHFISVFRSTGMVHKPALCERSDRDFCLDPELFVVRIKEQMNLNFIYMFRPEDSGQ